MSAKRRMNSCLLALSMLLLLNACSQPSKIDTGETAASASPHKYARATVYAIDPDQSSIILKVYRDGPLARFGHNHVIAATGLSGKFYREKELAQSGFELTLPVAQMTIDRPADRIAAGEDFPGELTPFAIAGTRENMLGPKLLAATQYPDIQINSLTLRGESPDLIVEAQVIVRGIESQLSLPAHIELSDNRIVVQGHFTLSQTQLGLTPFSVLGGGLRVRDTIDVDYHILAIKVLATKNIGVKK